MQIIRLALLALVVFVFSVSIVSAPGGVEISPASPTDNDSLTCTIDDVDPDDRDLYIYRWYENGGLQSTPSTPWVYPASRTEVGDVVACSVFLPLSIFIGTDSVTIEEEPPEEEPPVEENHPPEVAILVIVPYESETETWLVGDVFTFVPIVIDLDPDETFTYSWDFGDSAASTAVSPTHSYSAPGEYTITLVVSDGEDTGSDTVNLVIVAPPSEPPVADVDVSDPTLCPGQTVTFDARGSEGDIAFYRWNFGDGEVRYGSSVETHAYDEEGFYSVRLTVTAYNILQDSESVLILVDDSYCEVLPEENLPPVAIAGPDRVVNVGDPVFFNGLLSFDPDGEIVFYAWNFGDGTPTIELPLVVHSFSEPGEYIVNHFVMDNDGAFDLDIAIITVLEEEPPIVLEPPVAVIDVERTDAFLGFELEFDGSESYDPDGTILSYEWDFGDGATARGAVVSHTFVESGVYDVTLTVKDNDSLTDTETVSITAGGVDFGLDGDRPRTNPSINIRDVDISRIMAVNYRPFYNRGENVALLVKLTNEGSVSDSVDLKVILPEFNYVSIVNNINLGPSEVNWVTVSVPINSNAASGLHLARLELMPEDDSNDIEYWGFVVA